jgi:hypothetical protein
MKKKLFNLEEVKKMYYVEKLSLENISLILNTTRITLRKFFKEHQLKILSRCSDKIFFTDKQFEIMNGCLLGDGCVTNNGKYHHFVYGSSIKNHTNLVYEQFKEISNKIKENKSFDERTNKIYISYRFTSILNKTFTELKNKWYQNNKKIIPDDLKLTKSVCLYWYIGDGSLAQAYNKKETSYLKLSTNCFTIEDIDNILIPQLVEFEAYRWSNLIFIPRKNIIKFLSFIGDCPIPEYKHKWNVFPYKNKNTEINGVKSHKHLVNEIIERAKSGIKPYKIANELNIESSLVKYYLKRENLFEPNTINFLLKNWILVDPIGNTYKTNNITLFAKEHGLSSSCLRDVAHGRKKHYKKWICQIDNH